MTPFLSLPEGKAGKTMLRILDSAESLFIEKGFNGTSLRTITQKAGVNLAAVNYHFGSKEALIKAVFMRRFLPYYAQAIAGFNQLKQRDDYHVEDVLNILLTPVAQIIDQQEKDHSHLFVRLVARMLVDQPDVVKQVLKNDAPDFAANCVALLSAKLPDIADEILIWRIHFTLKLLFHGFSGYDIFSLYSNQPEVVTDIHTVNKHLLSYLCAALTAPTEQHIS